MVYEWIRRSFAFWQLLDSHFTLVCIRIEIKTRKIIIILSYEIYGSPNLSRQCFSKCFERKSNTPCFSPHQFFPRLNEFIISESVAPSRLSHILDSNKYVRHIKLSQFIFAKEAISTRKSNRSFEFDLNEASVFALINRFYALNRTNASNGWWRI